MEQKKAKAGDKRIGNKFWLLRSKHGRDKLFSTPELLKEAVYEYFDWCVKNPFKEQLVFHAKGIVTKTDVTKMRPFTIQGLTSYLHVNIQYFNEFEEGVKDKNNPVDKDFSAVITHIRETIYNQKFSGAASGFFNANIIARDLGLTDKQDIDHKTKGEKITGINYIIPTE
ncbi:MAG: DNA-packaging protein [Bacteroidales bacterium]